MSQYPYQVKETETDKIHEVFFHNTVEDASTAEMFICIEETKAIDMGMTVIETTQKEVITGCTGSEYLITEPRTFAFVSISGDDRFTKFTMRGGEGGRDVFDMDGNKLN